MTDNQALDAAIVAAGLDPRNPAVREAWQAGIEKYLEVRNSEAVAWQYAIGGDEWDLAADATEATRRRDFGLDVRPLFLAPSAGGETAKVKRLRFEAQNRDKTLYVSEVSVTGEYRVSHTGNSWEVSVRGWVVAREHTSEKAINAAQAHHADRIRSALTPSSETDKEKGR